jgi:hypothetical protein
LPSIGRITFWKASPIELLIENQIGFHPGHHTESESPKFSAAIQVRIKGPAFRDFLTPHSVRYPIDPAFEER